LTATGSLLTGFPGYTPGKPVFVAFLVVIFEVLGYPWNITIPSRRLL
jgi:hypothetical protein